MISMILMVFATEWWRKHFKPVINTMHLDDIRNPSNLDQPHFFGFGSKRGRGDQLDSDSEESDQDNTNVSYNYIHSK